MDSFSPITTTNSSDQQEMALTFGSFKSDTTPPHRRVGRPSLPPDERLFRKRASKKAWQARNWEYFKRGQCAEIQQRSESRARRVELDKLRRRIARKTTRADAK
jgi:hypothetical protein